MGRLSSDVAKFLTAMNTIIEKRKWVPTLPDNPTMMDGYNLILYGVRLVVNIGPVHSTMGQDLGIDTVRVTVVTRSNEVTEIFNHTWYREANKYVELSHTDQVEAVNRAMECKRLINSFLKRHAFAKEMSPDSDLIDDSDVLDLLTESGVQFGRLLP